MCTKTLIAILSGSMVALLLSVATSDDSVHKCDRCGCECVPVKVCRPVEETKKVAKIEFDCACEDFCVPGRSNLCGVEKGCDECGNVTCKRIWEPTCAQVRSKCVLKKSTVEEEVKVIKWVVEEVCDACASGSQAIEPSAQIPDPTPILAPGAALPKTGDSQSKPWLVESQSITPTDARLSRMPYFAPAADSNSIQPATNSVPTESAGAALRR